MKKLSAVLLALAVTLTLTGALYAIPQHQGHQGQHSDHCAKDGCCKAEAGNCQDCAPCKDGKCCKEGGDCACCKEGKCTKECTCKSCSKEGKSCCNKKK
jgi:hypothetical protein